MVGNNYGLRGETYVIRILFPSFFFSSRRRHTRCYRDWSSDVCSSDLGCGVASRAQRIGLQRRARGGGAAERVVRLRLGLSRAGDSENERKSDEGTTDHSTTPFSTVLADVSDREQHCGGFAVRRLQGVC